VEDEEDEEDEEEEEDEVDEEGEVGEEGEEEIHHFGDPTTSSPGSYVTTLLGENNYEIIELFFFLSRISRIFL
jgi:hypothetical protein